MTVCPVFQHWAVWRSSWPQSSTPNCQRLQWAPLSPTRADSPTAVHPPPAFMTCALPFMTPAGVANLVAGPLINSATGVTDGLFTVTLDFGGGVFVGTPYWLEIGVRTNGGGSFATLNPRQPLTPSPYAIFAGTAADVASGSIGPNNLSPSLLSSTFWRLAGNAGTPPGVNFLGTTDNQPLELKVNGARVLRLEPNFSHARANSPASSSLGKGCRRSGSAPGRSVCLG